MIFRHFGLANVLLFHELTILRRGTRSTIAMNRIRLPRTQASEAGCAPPISAGNLAAPQTRSGSHRISHRIAWKYFDYPKIPSSQLCSFLPVPVNCGQSCPPLQLSFPSLLQNGANMYRFSTHGYKPWMSAERHLWAESLHIAITRYTNILIIIVFLNIDIVCPTNLWVCVK